MIKKLLLLGVILILFNSCSWVERFVILNKTKDPVKITYDLFIKNSGFAIFGDVPEVYNLNEWDNIEWTEKGLTQYNQTITYNKDSSERTISYTVLLPPKTALLFGRISNFNYTKYNDSFINDRYFNLQKLNIYQKDKPLEIIPSTFDNYFKNKEGNISYTMK